MKRIWKQSVGAFAALTLFGLSGAANAGLIFDPTANGSSVDITPTWGICALCSVSTSFSSALDAEEMELEVGDSWTFDFFDITVSGLIGGSLANISATLAFDSPSSSASLDGSGGYGTIFGVLSAGYLEWNGPTTVRAGGALFDVNFSDVLALGLGNTRTVTATVTLRELSVPEPGALSLLGLGLMGLAFARKRSAA